MEINSYDDLVAAANEAAQRFAAKIDSAISVNELMEIEPGIKGKKSAFVEFRKFLGRLEPDERPSAGAIVQEIVSNLNQAFDTKFQALKEIERKISLQEDRLDLTEVIAGLAGSPVGMRGKLHPVTQAREKLEDTFLGMGFSVEEGPEIETDWFNFEALNIPPSHPARGMWDTFYLDIGEPETILLRTHTSPVQVRVMMTQKPPIYSVMPGRCFRRDTPDARHLAVFHQIEGLVIDKGITFASLAGTIDRFTTAYFGPNIHARLRPAYFPFTEPSAEFEINCTICEGHGCRTCSNTGWIELGGCGMVDPNVFLAVGIDPEEWSGFAFGFGIDRLVQMRYSLPDIRVLIENDLRHSMSSRYN